MAKAKSLLVFLVIVIIAIGTWQQQREHVKLVLSNSGNAPTDEKTNPLIELEASVKALNRKIEKVVAAFSGSGSHVFSVAHPRFREEFAQLELDAVAREPAQASGTHVNATSPPFHLGGFHINDTDAYSPPMWTYIMKKLVVRSVVDLGCGRGVSTSWFKQNGAEVLCVEGSADAIASSLLDPQEILRHDFTLGPWWPRRTFDAVFLFSFAEHIGRAHFKNYLPALRQASLIFFTRSSDDGRHLVEKHFDDDWWMYVPSQPSISIRLEAYWGC
jgi:hypothetical protein